MKRRTDPDAAVKKSRLVRHRDGTVSVKRTNKRAPITLAPNPMLARKPPELAPEPKTLSAAKNARKVAKLPPEPPTARAKTFQERHHHDWDANKSAIVTTTNRSTRILKRAKARTGSHIEAFERDYQIAASDLRSPSMDGAPGGGAGLPIPLAKVQAVDRLKEFEERYPRAFTVCEAVIIHGAQPSTIHKLGGPQHSHVTRMIQDAVEDLASFYTPKRKRPDKALAAFAKYVELAKREANRG